MELCHYHHTPVSGLQHAGPPRAAGAGGRRGRDATQAGEHLRDSGQQDPHHQGGVQQGQGADEDLRGGHRDDEVRGLLRLLHHALGHGEVGGRPVAGVFEGV